MRYHANVPDNYFHVAPREFDGRAPRERLQWALGATLYVPGNRETLGDDVRRRHAEGVNSFTLDLEDAIRDRDVGTAQANVIRQLSALHRTGTAPLVFVRVREPDQILELANGLGDALPALTAVVLPKFRGDRTGINSLANVARVRETTGHPLYAMPIIEGTQMAHPDFRRMEFVAAKTLLGEPGNPELILGVRTGATDLAGAFGQRRPPTINSVDFGAAGEVLRDAAQWFGLRPDGTGFLVSGAVHEGFDPSDVDPADSMLPALIAEMEAERAAGLIGKPLIHPSHAPVVNAGFVVARSEYEDAKAIVGAADVGGVIRSGDRNKMNEVKPHLLSARHTLCLADVFGVADTDVTSLDILAATDQELAARIIAGRAAAPAAGGGGHLSRWKSTRRTDFAVADLKDPDRKVRPT